ncbi:MAG: hypothetical protein IJ733_11300 [Lachnospiraceae bacterium]|nr:hypothetical protein [Lachnospiraceae bacterium]
MELQETEKTTELVLERMDNSLTSLEQMSFDSINITDKLVNGIDEIRKCMSEMKTCAESDREFVAEMMEKMLGDLLVTAFEVNNISHELEQQASYQRGTVENIKQIVDFLYAMQ